MKTLWPHGFLMSVITLALGAWLGVGCALFSPEDASPEVEPTNIERTHTAGDPLSGCTSTQERELVRLANDARDAAGLAPLHCAGELSAVAQRYAERMCAGNFLAHTDPDGTTMKQRVDQAGIDYQAIGENLAMGAPTPARVHQGWMKSQPHRENLLQPIFSRLGTGYTSCKGRHFWVQNFAN